MTVTQLRSDLQGSRERLFTSIRGLTEEQFRFAPDAGAWPIATHLGHLLRSERLHVERIRSALDEGEPAIASTHTTNDDEPGFAQKLAVPQMIHGMLNARRDLDALLDRCSDAELARAIRHERLGRVTVLDMFTKMTAHESEHGAEVAKLVRQVPASGRVIIPLTRRS